MFSTEKRKKKHQKCTKKRKKNSNLRNEFVLMARYFMVEINTLKQKNNNVNINDILKRISKK